MIMLLWLLAMFAPAQSGSPGYAAYERANALFARQQFQASLDAVEEALRLDSKLVPALTLRAKLAMAAGRNELSRADLERAVSADPASAYAQFLLGLVLYQQNELRLAVGPLEAAVRQNPKDPRAALYLGLCRESLGDTAEAAALYERAVRLEEASGKPQVETYLIAARLRIVMDQLDAARQLVEKALRADPNSRDAHFESARLEARHGRFGAAAKAAERALALSGGETNGARIHALLARCYQALGDTAAAARHAGSVRGN
jgi:tetratricopeptide (TPR) repeat protein